MFGSFLASAIAHAAIDNAFGRHGRHARRHAARHISDAATAITAVAAAAAISQAVGNNSNTAQPVKTDANAPAANDLYAKFAICCYIARADGRISDEEKADLDAIFLDIYNRYQNDAVRKELLKMYNTPKFTFVVLEPYLQATSPSVIASCLELAEDIASTDLEVSESEKNCIYKIRRYLTDRTGKDYMKYTLRTNKDVNLVCPNCASGMEVKSYDNSLVCPNCGTTRYVAVS